MYNKTYLTHPHRNPNAPMPRQNGGKVIKIDKGHAASLNMATLQRADPKITKVLASASHVVVYDSDTGGQWVGTA